MLPLWSQGPRIICFFSGPDCPTTTTLPSLGVRCSAGRGIDGIVCLGTLLGGNGPDIRRSEEGGERRVIVF